MSTFINSIITSAKPIILHVFKIMAVEAYHAYNAAKVVNIKTIFIKIIFSNLYNFIKVINKIIIFLYNCEVFYNYKPFLARLFTLNNYFKTIFKFIIIIFNIIKIIKKWRV